MSSTDTKRGGETPPPGDLPRTVLDSLLEGCQVISPDFRYLYVNDATVRQARMPREALEGRKMVECFPGIDETAMFQILRRCMNDRTPAMMENEFTFPDGTSGWFELRFEPVPGGVAILSVEITDRKHTEVALGRTMRALTTLSRSNQTLVRATDEQQFIEAVCRLVSEAGGYRGASITLASAEGSEHPDLVARAGIVDGAAGDPPGGRRLSLPVRAAGATLGTLTILAAEPDAFDEGERAVLDEVAADLGYGIETLRARSLHKVTEEQLVASQRLEAVARLAGGVAHDFNNLLSVILSYAGFIADGIDPADPLREDVEHVRDASRRAAALTGQLLAFSRRQILEPRVTDLNEVVAGIEAILRRLIGEDVEIQADLSNDLGNVCADPGKLEQVLMNLAVNARDAMPRGGRLTIETRNVERGEGESDGELGPGPYVRLAVGDTGIGMSAETRQQIFEPFYTTKETGKGTGLGLSMVHGIVKQSGGDITVTSEPGRGTRFEILLPRVDADADDRVAEPPPATGGGSETVMLVEDDDGVRGAAKRILQSAGYRVHAAANGEEALQLATVLGNAMDLLLTDVVLPRMSGRELADRLRARRPDLKVLFTSGYTDDAIVHHGVLDPDTRFIAKPFSGADLARRVRQVLDEPA